MEPASHANSIMVGNRYGNTGSETYEFIKMMPSKASFSNTDTTSAIENYDYADIAASSWHHYAMVKSGTSCQWYVDGVAEGAPVTINYNESSPLPFLIGGDDDGSGTKVNEHFEGCIDDVLLYREALTPAEVVDVKNGNYPYPPPVYELIAGWDMWNSATAPTATVLASNVSASALVTAVQQSWNVTDERGASNDGDWGTFAGIPTASIVTNADNENLTLINAATGGAITLTVMNGGTDSIELGSLHFDAYAFRPKAPRTYELSVLPGGGISDGVVFTSVADAIPETGGTADNGAHADIDIPLEGLADHTLEPGESAQFQLAFSGGAGDSSGGHHLFVDNLGLSGVFTEYIAPPVIDLIAGWDTWDSTTVPSASFTAVNVNASATASATGGNWSNSDGSGRGSSKDTTWGTYDGGGNPASAVTDVGPANFTLTDAKTDGVITFTVNNTGTQDILLDRFHFDAVAFRPNAARTYALNILAGSDISVGNVFTSPDDAITSLGGGLLTDDADPLTHDQHDDIEIDLSGLADHTLEAGGTAVIQLAFSSGTGDGGGHHLFLDNVGISGIIELAADPEPPVLEVGLSGGDLEFTWTEGGFKVQSCTNLMDGTWFDVPGGGTPPVTISPTNPEAFFRLIEQ